MKKPKHVCTQIKLRCYPVAMATNVHYVIESLIDAGESGTFDFIYVDGDKLNADVIYELSLKLLRTNGIIAFDNVSSC